MLLQFYFWYRWKILTVSQNNKAICIFLHLPMVHLSQEKFTNKHGSMVLYTKVLAVLILFVCPRLLQCHKKAVHCGLMIKASECRHEINGSSLIWTPVPASSNSLFLFVSLFVVYFLVCLLVCQLVCLFGFVKLSPNSFLSGQW